MQLSGVVLDVYDDPSSLKEVYSDLDTIPDMVKQAHLLTEQERKLLPDSTFALVLLNGESRMRKYACTDPGNTLLSTAYFLKYGHKLPTEAQKVAAANLKRAAEWYGLDVPEPIEKVAIGLGTAATLALMGPTIVKGTSQDIRGNLGAINALESPQGVIGGRVVTPREMQMMKGGEVSNTHLQPAQTPGDKETGSKKGMGPKVAAELVDRKDADPTLEQTKGQPGEQYQKPPQAKDLQPHVDVSNKEPPKLIKEKQAQRYALRGALYPLDSYAQVKAASTYFDEYGKRLSSADRHEYCMNMVKRADVLGIEVSDLARKYGSSGYAPADEIKVALDMRRRVLQDQSAIEMLDGLEEKVASINPDVFCLTLGAIDRAAEIDWMYDRAIMDPELSTYGFTKKASDESWVNGNLYFNKRQADMYGKTGMKELSRAFGDDFAKEYRKDPWGIFSSLPLDQKRMIANMATDTAPQGNDGVETSV